MTTPAVPAEMTGTVPLSLVRPSPTNPRKHFDQAKLEELADSIREHGVLQNIVVRPVAEAGKAMKFDGKKWHHLAHFEIVAGERRFRAATLAGLKELHARVLNISDADVLALQLVENDQREDVRPTEQAAAYKRLADAVGQKAAAERTGRSESAIRGWCKLAKCPPDLAAAVDAGTVSRSVAEVVCGVGGDEARRKAAFCVLGGHTSPVSIHPAWLAGTKTPDLATASEPPLTYREAKELIARHFQRETGKALFPTRKPLDLLPTVPACVECPKYGKNLKQEDPEGFADLRNDICTDPDCFETKERMHQQHLVEAWKKSNRVSGPVEPVGGWQGEQPPKGYCDLNASIRGSELGSDWKREDTLLVVLSEIPGALHSPAVHLGFDAKGKPRTLVRTTDVRRRLVAAGLMSKPGRPMRNVGEAKAPAPQTPAVGDDEPYKLWRLAIDGRPTFIEFSAVAFDPASALRDFAEEAFLEAVRPSLTWEEVPATEADVIEPATA